MHCLFNNEIIMFRWEAPVSFQDFEKIPRSDINKRGIRETVQVILNDETK